VTKDGHEQRIRDGIFSANRDCHNNRDIIRWYNSVNCYTGRESFEEQSRGNVGQPRVGTRLVEIIYSNRLDIDWLRISSIETTVYEIAWK